jgi:hypothetical protein
LGALANVCIQVGKLLGAHTQEEKQDGVTNLIGTAFGLASNISAIDAAYVTENKEVKNREKEFLVLLELIQNIHKVIKNSKVQLNKVDGNGLIDYKLSQERILWICKSLLPDDLVEEFVDSIFMFLKSYLHSKIDLFLDSLKDKVLGILCVYKPEEESVFDLEVEVEQEEDEKHIVFA